MAGPTLTRRCEDGRGRAAYPWSNRPGGHDPRVRRHGAAGSAERSEISDEDAGRLLNTVLDEGINFIDTSIDYGRSEELIGKYIAHRRDGVCAGIEVRVRARRRHRVRARPHAPRTSDSGSNTACVCSSTDHLDLVQFHRSLSRQEFEAEGALAEAMALRDEGKVRFVGVSAVLPTLNEQIDMGVFDAFQIPYSALQREHEDIIVGRLTRAWASSIRGGVARGVPDDWEGRRYYMVANDTMRDYWDGAGLDELLDGMSRTAFMLRFTLSHPALDTTIVGTSSVGHLRDNLAAAASGALPEDLLRTKPAGSRPPALNPRPKDHQLRSE